MQSYYNTLSCVLHEYMDIYIYTYTVHIYIYIQYRYAVYIYMYTVCRRWYARYQSYIQFFMPKSCLCFDILMLNTIRYKTENKASISVASPLFIFYSSRR